MLLRVIALGHRMPAWVAAGFDEYAKRMPRDSPLELIELKPEPRDRGRSVAQMLAAEADRARAAAGAARIVALDERGAPWTTRQLARNLQQWRLAGGDVAFLIGSADGLDPELKRRAAARLALSAMTLPHGLVRVLLAEQLYRATTLIAGHPYHRDVTG
jgi:23S rRNA (pseudouridine1915-N3)-methyltransferase